MILKSSTGTKKGAEASFTMIFGSEVIGPIIRTLTRSTQAIYEGLSVSSVLPAERPTFPALFMLMFGFCGFVSIAKSGQPP